MQARVYSHLMARRGRPNITIRMDPDQWERFGQLTDDRSAVVRALVAWYVRDPGAKLPRRPGIPRTDEPITDGDGPHSAA